MHVVTDDDPVERELTRQETIEEPVVLDDMGSIPLETVSIRIDSEPENLTVLWNGEIMFERPLVVPKGENGVEVRFKSPGYQEETLTVVPDQEKTVSVKLKKLRGRKKRPR